MPVEKPEPANAVELMLPGKVFDPVPVGNPKFRVEPPHFRESQGLVPYSEFNGFHAVMAEDSGQTIVAALFDRSSGNRSRSR